MILSFKNGYQASVITGKMFYSSDDEPYEVAVMRNDEIVYDTPITNDVLGYLTAHEVNDVLAKIEDLPVMAEAWESSLGGSNE